MKIQEFRDKIKKATREQIAIIASELYRMLPKNKKEVMEENFDSKLEIILNSDPNEKIKLKSEKPKAIPFINLKNEILNFFFLVDRDLYFAPNKFVSKTERSKWRFKVKSFIKELDKITISSDDYKEAAELYKEIYRRLCHACAYYILSTQVPFNAVGIPQVEFLHNVLKKYFINGYSKETLSSMIDLVTNTYVDQETAGYELIYVLVEDLPTRDVREQAIELAKDRLIHTYLKIPKEFSNESFRFEERKERLLDLILALKMKNHEGREGVDFYLKNGDFYSDKYYSTLCHISRFHQMFNEKPSLWIEMYEEFVKNNKLKPDKRLMEEYEELKKQLQ